MATDVTKIHIGQGDLWLGGTPPAAGGNPNDPTTSALNSMTTNFAAPTSGGTAIGFTNGPATLTYRPTYYMVETEQAFAEVITIPTNEETTLQFIALQATYLNIAAATGQGTTAVNAGVTETIYVGSKPTLQTQLVVLNSRKRTGTGYYILSLYQGYSNDGLTMNFERRKETQMQTTIRTLADTTRPVGDQLFQLVNYMANPA